LSGRYGFYTKLFTDSINNFISIIPAPLDNFTPQPKRRAALRIKEDSSGALSPGLSGTTNSPSSSPKEIEGFLEQMEQMINQKEFGMAEISYKKARQCLSKIPENDNNKGFYRQKLNNLSERCRTEKLDTSLVDADQAIIDGDLDVAARSISTAAVGLSHMLNGAEKDSYAAKLAGIAVQHTVEKTYKLMDQTLIKARQAIDNKNFDQAKFFLDEAAILLPKIIDRAEEAGYKEKIMKLSLRFGRERTLYMTTNPSMSLLSQSNISSQSGASSQSSHTPRQGSSLMFMSGLLSMSGLFGSQNREENKSESAPRYNNYSKK
jgi:hypothetical protein